MEVACLQNEAGEEGVDMLPGLYKVAQQWMADVAASRFPELRASGATFDAWFKSHRVKKHLKASSWTKEMDASKKPFVIHF